MPKLQHLAGNAFYSERERDINCFPQFRTLLQAQGRRRDDTWRLKITLQVAREAAIESHVCCCHRTHRMLISPWTRALFVHLLEFAEVTPARFVVIDVPGQSVTWWRWSCWLSEFWPFAQLVPNCLVAGDTCCTQRRQLDCWLWK